MAVLIVNEKVTSISDENYGICYFAIKDTHWSLPGINDIFGLAKAMEKFLNILNAPRPNQQQDNFVEEKTRYISSNISIWDFYGIPQVTCLICLVRFLACSLIFGLIFFCCSTRSINWNWQRYFSGHKEFEQNIHVKKYFFWQRVETTITKEKSNFKRNTVDVWPEYGYFKQQPRDFGIKKENFPENSIFYLNQGYQSVKDNKNNYYANHFLIGQVNKCLNLPEDLINYRCEDSEVKMYRSRYDSATGSFQGLLWNPWPHYGQRGLTGTFFGLRL